MSIDVVVCTWNSNRGYFRRCIQSIQHNVPIHHLIVIDRNSSDGTVETIRQLFPRAIVKISLENLGKARRTAVALVDTSYFAFIDDDIEIPEDWFIQLQKQLTAKIGAIHNIPYPSFLPPEIRKWDKWRAHWEKKGVRNYEDKTIDVTSANQQRFRGLTNNTIIRTELLGDWNPPEDLTSFEDWLIMRHIVEKGYIWRIIRDHTVMHHRPRKMSEHLTQMRWNLVGARISGFDSRGLRIRLAQSLIMIPSALIASIQYGDPRIMVYVFNLHRAFVDSYLMWNRYRVVYR